jgi:T4 RnlA family RNA ligase
MIWPGEMVWGTKMGATDVAKPVEEFVEANPHYRQFANFTISRGYTPIFEWCSRKQRIVLDYKEDQLILTAIRDITTGRYMSHDLMEAHAEAYRIPVVRTFGSQNHMRAFVEYVRLVRLLEDREGFVVRFSDGHMLKLKCDWYVQIHKAKEKILQDRNIVELILDEKLDDVKAHLPVEDRNRLTKFENDFNDAVREVVYDIYTEIVDLNQREIDRKTFAIEIAPKMDPLVVPIIFSLWNTDVIGNLEIFDKVRNTVRNNLTKTVKYEALRDAWFPGVKYNDCND